MLLSGYLDNSQYFELQAGSIKLFIYKTFHINAFHLKELILKSQRQARPLAGQKARRHMWDTWRQRWGPTGGHRFFGATNLGKGRFHKSEPFSEPCDWP